MDDADAAQDHIDKTLVMQIEEARVAFSRAPHEGCLNCDEHLDDGRCYCDEDCRKQFDLREKLRRIMGRS